MAINERWTTREPHPHLRVRGHGQRFADEKPVTPGPASSPLESEGPACSQLLSCPSLDVPMGHRASMHFVARSQCFPPAADSRDQIFAHRTGFCAVPRGQTSKGANSPDLAGSLARFPTAMQSQHSCINYSKSENPSEGGSSGWAPTLPGGICQAPFRALDLGRP